VVLRTRDNIRPLFVSPGHMVDIKGAVEVVSGCLGKYRIPEPLRCADLLTKKIKRGNGVFLLR
jgi:deoxyribonuclease V